MPFGLVIYRLCLPYIQKLFKIVIRVGMLILRYSSVNSCKNIVIKIGKD